MQKLNRIVVALFFSTSLAAGNVGAADGIDMSSVSTVAAVAAPAAFITGGASYLVKSVEASADGTVYQLEKNGAGVSGSITVVGSALGELLLNAGATIKASAVAEGVLLVSDDQALALVPAKLIKRLLQN